MSGNPIARRDVICSLAEPGWNYGITRSPFYAYDVEQGAQYCVYNRRLMPVSLNTITREDGYWALRRGVTRLDTGELVTEIAGPDAAALLDRLFTRQVSKIKPGRCTYGVACWPDGGLLVDGILVRLEQDRFWYVQADGDFVGWLKAHALGLDVTVRDPHSFAHQLQGPKALDLLARICDDGLPENFTYFAARTVRIGGQDVLITRTGWTGELGFEVYTTPDLDTDSLWQHITAAGEDLGLVDIGLDSMDTRRIEAGILNNISDMDSSMTPYAAGLGVFVNLDRTDDFFGKEALAAVTDRRSRIVGISCPGGEPLTGGAVLAAGQGIGRITAASWSPHLKAGIGYAQLDSADQAGASDVSVVTFDGTEQGCTLVELPFYDPEKKISRGLEVVEV